MNKTIALLTLALCPLHALGAQPERDVDRLMPLSLDELLDVQVAISTRSLQQMSRAPSVVSVVTAEDIKATGATNLADVLQSVPGIYVKRNLFAFRPVLSVRGAPGTHTLFMVNGLPARDLVWSTGIFWKGLPASAIERVEIIRGPGSALFGADASAGVINVITRTAAPIARSEAGLRAGSFDTQSGWLQFGSDWGGTSVGLTAEVGSTDGHRPRIAGDARGDEGRVNYDWDGGELRLSLARGAWRLLADHARRADLGVGLSGGAVLDPRNQSRDEQSGLALLYDNPRFAADWGLNATLRYRDLSYSSGNGFIYPVDGDPEAREFLDSAERQAGAEVTALYTGARQHALRLGLSASRNEIHRASYLRPDGGIPIPNNRRDNVAFFLQDVWSLHPDWELTAGLRYDHFNDFGDAWTPRLALVWQASERLSAKLLYGEAFRAPAYLELYVRTSANLPNPDLEPERSRTWELAFDYRAHGGLRLGLNLYRFERTDLVAADPATKQFKNFGEFAVRGVELEAAWQAAPSLMLIGNLSHRDEDESPIRDLSLPADSAYARLDWAFLPKWKLNLQTSWFGARPLPSGDKRRELGSYGLVDATLRYRPDSRWELAVSARNLLDAEGWDYSSARLPGNLPLPGRNVYAELRYAF